MDAIARPSVQDLQEKSADLSFAIKTAGDGGTAPMVTPIDMAPLLAIEPVVMGEMKPVLELLKQLVHNSQADRAEIARQHRQISDLRNAVCRLQAIHATPKTATTVDMSPDSVSRLDLSPSLPIQSFADLDDLRQDLASVAPDPNPAPLTTSKLLPRRE